MDYEVLNSHGGRPAEKEATSFAFDLLKVGTSLKLVAKYVQLLGLVGCSMVTFLFESAVGVGMTLSDNIFSMDFLLIISLCLRTCQRILVFQNVYRYPGA